MHPAAYYAHLMRNQSSYPSIMLARRQGFGLAEQKVHQWLCHQLDQVREAEANAAKEVKS